MQGLEIEKSDTNQQIQKQRQKQTEQAILFDQWMKSTEELEILIKSISDKVK